MSGEAVATTWERRCHMATVGTVVAGVLTATIVVTTVVANSISQDPSWQQPWQKDSALTAAITGIPVSGALSLCGLAKLWRCFCASGDGGSGRDCNVVKF